MGGFKKYGELDLVDRSIALQDSSLAGEPGAWLGVHKRSHGEICALLRIPDAQKLIGLLQEFVDTNWNEYVSCMISKAMDERVDDDDVRNAITEILEQALKKKRPGD
jgi:hypothetical protein